MINKIIITSDEEWSDVWHTQLHYAYQLSRYFDILYLEPPGNWNIRNLFYWKKTARRIFPGLILLRYHNFLPSFLGFPAFWINDRINQQNISRTINYNSEKDNLIIWHFDPFR